jgi:glycosyltransferase involved in cell wall biosynthesis
MKITLCILTLNERPCLEVMFPRIAAQASGAAFDDIVAIDGGSTDGTVEFFKDHDVAVLAQTGGGRGGAMLLALEKIEADAFVFFSPDGNEDADDLPKFRPLLDEGADLVIASRMMTGAHNEEDNHVLKWRKWANNAFTILANAFFRGDGSYVTDTINGYRAFTKSAAAALDLDALDYTIEYQMTIRALGRRMKIVEFATFEGERIAGETGAPSIPTGLKFMKCLWREWKRNR